MILTIFVFIITIGVLIIIHELGHFLTAKKFGIKVLEFGFGLPPRAIGKKVGETIFSLNWLPFGGFVHLLGEDELDPTVSKDKRSFAAQPVWKRITVVLAGVVMNLLVAWVLFYIVLYAQNFRLEIPLQTPHQFWGVNQTNENVILVSKTIDNSPAKEAGINAGERVIAVNDQFMTSADQLVQSLKDNAGTPIKLTLSDPQRTTYRVVELTPRVNPPDGEGAVGISLAGYEVAILESPQLWQKVLAGPILGYNLTVYSFELLGSAIGSSVSKGDVKLTEVRENVTGFIGIGYFLNSILESADIKLLLFFIATISLNLAIFNVFPIPGLDGGRLMFLIYEAVTRRKPNAKVEKYIHSVGLSFLLILLVLVTIQDFNRFILNP